MISETEQKSLAESAGDFCSGIAEFSSSEGEALRKLLAGSDDKEFVREFLSAAEHEWDLEWLSWAGRNVLAGFWDDLEIVARWLTYELALGNASSIQTLVFLLENCGETQETWPAVVYDALGRHAFIDGDFSKGESLLSEGMRAYPDWDWMWCKLARLDAMRDADDGTALEAADALLKDFIACQKPLTPLLEVYSRRGQLLRVVDAVERAGGFEAIDGPYEAYLYFSALESLGALRRVLEELPTYLDQNPDSFLVMHILRAVAHKLDRLDEVLPLLERCSKDKSAPEAREIRLLCALDRDDYTSASKIYSGFKDKTDEAALRSRLTLATTIPGSKDAGSAFRAYRDTDVRHAGPEIQYVSFLFAKARNKKHIHEILKLLVAAKERGESNVAFVKLYLKALIALGRNGDAQRYIDALPDAMRNSWNIVEAQNYLHQARGNHDQVYRAWEKQLELVDYRVSVSSSSAPKLVRAPMEVLPEGCIVFCCIYNGIEYLEWFLKHYRGLGITCFFMVDNGSTDGTAEFLAQQPDVWLFSQPESFKQAAHGVVWINHLIQKYAMGRWILFVDMDEALVFPGHGSGRTLNDLLDYADHHEFSAFPSFMLDMYAPAWSKDPFSFDSHSYFDSDYFTFPSLRAPYLETQGGVRSRLTKRQFLITKSPLVRVRQGFKFLENNHTHTHLPIADVSVVLLHYKLIGDLSARIDDAIQRREHYMAGRLYRDLSSALQKQKIWPTISSRRYRGADHLVRMGLMHSSDAWEKWPSNRILGK